MSCIKINNVSVKGIAAAVPKTEYNNLDYNYISYQERELFIKNTGIKTRRVAPDGMSTSDMCYEPAKQLIQKLNWQNDEIDIIIMVTQSPDYFIPGSAVILQDRLNLKKSCLAFDINLGCSGYVYGLFVISSLLSNGQLKKGILCVGDKSTSSTSFMDKSTFPLFGDAAGVTALEFDIHSNEMFFNLSSDGSGKDAINIEHGGSRHGLKKDTFISEEIAPGIVREKRHLKLDGIEILNFALREVVPNIKELFDFSNCQIDSIDYFVFHQANKLINESVRKKLKLNDQTKYLYSLEHFGNTSSASIPLTLVTEIPNEIINRDLTFCWCGFGVGYSWGSVLLKTSNLVCLPLIEIN